MEEKKILVVDDEPHIRLLVSKLLGKDYTVLQANDGAEAIDIARHQRPDLILMDLMMPKVDGYVACSAIKTDHATRGIPVVMLTGVGHQLNRRLSEKMGASGYITKPFDLKRLLAVIAPLLPTS